MKRATTTRHTLLASILAGSALVSTGCSSGGASLASMNPFSKSGPAQDGAGLVASTTKSAKGAWGKTTSAVAGVFKGDVVADEATASDPLSLANTPKSIGPEVFVANGQMWESTGDFGKAMESYTKALESQANHAPALTSIARLHFRKGNFKEATQYFQQAITQNPQDAQLYNDLGLAVSKTGDYAGATAALEKALQLAPGTSRFANNLASVKFEAGDAQSAYQVLATNNKPAVAHFNMAYLHFKNGQMTKARGHLGEAVRFEPQASTDAAVQRAVKRSRDMLAQIDASMAPIAQAAPQATVAGGSYFAGTPKTAPIQQTSQSGSSNAGVAPAAPISPPSTSVRAASGPAASIPKASIPKASAPAASLPTPRVPAASAPATNAISLPTAAAAPKATPTRPMPVKPTESQASEKVESDAQPPSFPFALPTGFGTSESK